ncbi:MAG: hypothetical protein H6590_02425 [Flavobacteriales bacterium]|nr:hypothetical protein [Flavobacteriales bacterium]
MDNWGADDGTMCSWSISFDPALYPDLVEFTPVIGTGPDSVWWKDPELTITAPAGGDAITTPTATVGPIRTPSMPSTISDVSMTPPSISR